MLAFYLSMVEPPEQKSKVEEIYYQYKHLIYYLALKKLGDEHLTDEVLNDVMLAVIDNIKQLQPLELEEIKGFIYVATRNWCNKKLRKERRFAAENIDDLQLEPEVRNDPQELLGGKQILQYFSELPPIYREVLQLTAYYEMNTKAVAKMLKISEGAARKRLERARAMMRAAIAEDEMEKGEKSHV